MIDLNSNELSFFNELENRILKNKLKELSILSEYVYDIRQHLKKKYGGASLKCIVYIANRIDDFMKYGYMEDIDGYNGIDSDAMIDKFRDEYYSKFLRKNVKYNPKFGLSKSI